MFNDEKQGFSVNAHKKRESSPFGVLRPPKQDDSLLLIHTFENINKSLDTKNYFPGEISEHKNWQYLINL